MTQWTDVLDADRLHPHGRWLLRTNGHEIALFRVDGRLYALDDGCPHAGASLATGQLEGTTVACRAHGLRFDLATGCQRGTKGGLAVRSYPVRECAGRIEIDFAAPPAGPAGPAAAP